MITCCLFGTKPLSKTMLGYCQWDPSGTNFGEILINVQNFPVTKMRLKTSSAKWRPFFKGRWVQGTPFLTLNSILYHVASVAFSCQRWRVLYTKIHFYVSSLPRRINHVKGCVKGLCACRTCITLKHNKLYDSTPTLPPSTHPTPKFLHMFQSPVNYQIFGMVSNIGNHKRLETLQWRHDGRDSTSKHQPNDCLLNGSFRRRSKKTWKLHFTDLCPHKWSVTRKIFPFDDVIMKNRSMYGHIHLWWHIINIPCACDWTALCMVCGYCTP